MNAATGAIDTERLAPWITVLRTTSAVIIVSTLVVQIVLAGALIPPLLIFEILFAVGLGVVRRRPVFGVRMLGIVSVLFIIGDLPFGGPELIHPESFPTFVTEVAQLGAAVLGVVALVAAWRRAAPKLARRLLIGAGIVGVVLAVVSAATWVSGADTGAQPGDVALVAQSVEFQPTALTAPAGTVTVHLENRDAVRHTFTVEQLGVDVAAPAGKGRRVTFSAKSGQYAFRCTVPGHDDMKGTLTVA
jgi:plastocyanin